MNALKSVLADMASAVAPANLFPQPPQLRFGGDDEFCPHCGTALQVLKTLRRQVATLHIGHFKAHESVMICRRCSGQPSFHNRELADLVPAGCRFGYDVEVFAGLALLRDNRTVAETVIKLAEQNIKISETEVRELAARFVFGLATLHAEAAPNLRQQLGLNGGYILHLDSTCQKGSSHLLTGIDELSGFILMNVKIPSENRADMVKFLQELVERYGMPVAVNCDMSMANLSALAEAMPEVPVFVCHFHFLRDLGKDLMGEDYATLRQGLQRHGPKAELIRLQRQLREPMAARHQQIEQLLDHLHNDTEPSEKLLASLSGDAVLAVLLNSALEADKQGGGYGFPFDRAHLAFFQQLKSLLSALEALQDLVKFDRDTQILYGRAIKAITPVVQDSKLNTAASRIEKQAVLFDEFRSAMRLADPHAGKGLNDDGLDSDIPSIKMAVTQFRDNLLADQQRRELPGVKGMLAQIHKYWYKLFCDPIEMETPSGIVLVQPQRTNNILERFFRGINRACRKRTGNRLTAKFLDNLMPDVPLIANLDNPIYMQILLDGSKTLAQRLARVDRKAVMASLAQTRKAARGLSRKARVTLRKRLTPLQIALHFIRKVA